MKNRMASGLRDMVLNDLQGFICTCLSNALSPAVIVKRTGMLYLRRSIQLTRRRNNRTDQLCSHNGSLL